ncbi:MAG: hypothetical protein ACKVWR_01570 [Acidimicrobiales bacterium]
MTLMLALIRVDGLAWNPFIRGWLTVITGVLVLMGSIYLILATNSGVRTGMLLALTGLFGWMAIMGVIWWIYGIGLIGKAPTWEVVELNRGELSQAALDEARTLAEWKDFPVTNPKRGEAQATVDAFLVGRQEFANTAEYLPLPEAYEIGGKPVRELNMNMFERAWHKLKSIVNFRHPPHYAIIQVRAVTPESLITIVGQAPPRPQPDERQPVLSVIMERNLGDRRFPPAVIALGSIILFGAFAYMLHTREKRETQARAAFAGT